MNQNQKNMINMTEKQPESTIGMIQSIFRNKNNKKEFEICTGTATIVASKLAISCAHNFYLNSESIL